LLEIDAFHHVKDGVQCPATLLIHGINDPRVPVAESMKMAARLQASGSNKPVLLRLDYAAGHGMGSTKKQRKDRTLTCGASCFGNLEIRGFNLPK